MLANAIRSGQTARARDGVSFGDVSSVREDGTVDVIVDEGELKGIAATTACVGVEVGDRVMVYTSGRLSTVVGVIAKSLVAAPYVISDFLNGFRAYSSAQVPTLFRQGRIVVMTGAFGMDGRPDKGYSLDMATIPVGYRPVRQVASLQQASQQYKHLLIVSPGGYVSSSRYGTTDSTVQPMNNAWYNACATWWTDDPMPD